MKKIKMMIELFQLTRKHRLKYCLCLSFLVLSSLMKILSPFLIMRILDSIMIQPSLDRTIIYTVQIIFTSCLGTITEILYQHNICKFNRDTVIKLRTRCLEHIDKLSGDFLSNYKSGDLFTTLYRDVEELPSLITTSLFSFVSNLINVVGLFAFMITLQLDMVIILLLFQIVLYVIQHYYNKKKSETTETVRHFVGIINNSAQEMLGNLFAFTEGGLKSYYTKNYLKQERIFTDSYIKGANTLTLNHGTLSFINSLTIATLLCYGGYKVIIGSLSYGGLFTFILYSQRFMGPILQIVDFNNDLTAGIIAWKRLQQLLTIKIDVKDGMIIKTLQGDIQFEAVSFSYSKDKQVLRNVSLEFHKGKIYALVGPSGVGKTTITHLLFRLWDCETGIIYMDGIDIKNLNITCLRKQISVVSQSVFLLDDTIYNNIVLDESIASDELTHVLKQAGLYDFINTLPNGLNTIVGENGIRLSGGEKQRISIARALLKKVLF